MRTAYTTALYAKERRDWAKFSDYVFRIYVALDEQVPQEFIAFCNEEDEKEKNRLATIVMINLLNHLKLSGKY